MLLSVLQLRDAKTTYLKNQIKTKQEAVKLINPVNGTQYVFSCTFGHLGLMTCPLLVITCCPHPWNIAPVYSYIFIFIVSLFIVDNQLEGGGWGSSALCCVLCSMRQSRENINYSALKSQK